MTLYLVFVVQDQLHMINMIISGQKLERKKEDENVKRGQRLLCLALIIG